MFLFESTYICEQIFPHTRHARNKIKTKILDGHLKNPITIIKPDIDELVFIIKNMLSVLVKDFH